VPESRKLPILEITLQKVLDGLQMDEQQFIDLCILMGCDYCGTIKGCGPKTAHEWISKHKSINGVMKAIDNAKHPPPDPFNHEEIHAFFKEPEITPVSELQEKGLLVWKAPDFDGTCLMLPACDLPLCVSQKRGRTLCLLRKHFVFAQEALCVWLSKDFVLG
jgi:flap endonuclease-1